MPLGLLALLVVFGIGGIVLLVHLTGGSASARLADDAAVHSAWAEDWPEEPVFDVERNAAGTAALVRTTDAEGLIWTFGADTVSRKLEPGAIRALRPVEDALEVRFAAFDCPAVTLPLTRAELPDWHARLTPYLQETAT